MQHDYGALAQRVADSLKICENQCRQVSCPAAGGATNQQHRWSDVARQGEERPEVGVRRDDDPVAVHRSTQDLGISGTAHTEIGDVNGIVAGCDQAFDHPPRNVLVDEELHAG